MLTASPLAHQQRGTNSQPLAAVIPAAQREAASPGALRSFQHQLASGSISQQHVDPSPEKAVIVVPSKATPGVSRVRVDVGDSLVGVTVPEWARPGGRMVLMKGSSNEWDCYPAAGLEDPDGIESRLLECELVAPRHDIIVPTDAVPGTTELQIDLGVDDQAICFVVPQGCRPGDWLTLEWDHDECDWALRATRITNTSGLPGIGGWGGALA